MTDPLVVQKGESWQSKAGFIFAAAGSAVGLVNIWRFPYVVAEHGGLAFILLYLVFLALIGFPVLMAEVFMGRFTQGGSFRAFRILGGQTWGKVGLGVTVTGFVVSSFYSVIAGWILGYFVEAALGHFSGLSPQGAAELFTTRLGSAWWCAGYHFLFMGFAVMILVRGVRGGIERANRVLMPLLVVLLTFLAIRGWSVGGFGLMTQWDWRALTPIAVLIALGHAFFTLSLGQGTMITYGSYLSTKTNLMKACAPVVLFDTVISLLSAGAVLSLVACVEGGICEGKGLLFGTLPVAFGKITGGYGMGLVFFGLVALAALTSQISAMEPLIHYLVHERAWSRKRAVYWVGLGGMGLGLPSALSFSLLSAFQWNGKNFFDVVSFSVTELLIPLGGLAAVIVVGWVLGVGKALPHLAQGPGLLDRSLHHYLRIAIRYGAPVLIGIIFLSNCGLF